MVAHADHSELVRLGLEVGPNALGSVCVGQSALEAGTAYSNKSSNEQGSRLYSVL